MRGRLASFALLVAASALCAAGAELSIRWLDAFPEPRAFFRELGELPEAAATGEDERGALSRTLHPYLAWVDVPGRTAYSPLGLAQIFPQEQPSPWTLRNNRINRYGFTSELDDYAGVEASRFAIGLFGGSVAKDLAAVGGERLASDVARRLGLPRESVVVLNFASGGYKQPQQVIALAQMALLGLELDVVVNLDGYNELVAGARDSARAQHPLLPSQAQYAPLLELIGREPAAQAIETAAAALRARRGAREIRRLVLASPWLRRSELARAALGSWGLWRERRATLLEAELQEGPAPALPGPDLPDACAAPGEPCWELIADLWERGSRVMAALAASMGAQYLHLLQPNLYVESGKALTRRELANSYDPDASIPRWVREGYPRLRARGERLVAGGIAFFDLSLIFADRSETIYRDPCCHFNRHGNEILAARIAALVEP